MRNLLANLSEAICPSCYLFCRSNEGSSIFDSCCRHRHVYQSIVLFLTVKLPWLEDFMRVESHTDRLQSKTLILSTNVDQRSSETEFLIAICRPTGDKWQSKTPFLAIFYPRSSIVKSVFDRRLSGVNQFKCFKDVNFWRAISFTLKCIEIRKHLINILLLCASKWFCLYIHRWSYNSAHVLLN